MEIKRWGCRQARAGNRLLALPFKSGDKIDRWRHVLADHSEGGPDNHETYLVDGVAFQFSDGVMYIGTSIEET